MRETGGRESRGLAQDQNIIILMLLVTNLCLLAFVGWREIRDWQLQDKALEQAVSFLAERGIQVDERIVPRSAELPPMGMERDLEEEQTLAAALLGDGLTRRNAAARSMSMRGSGAAPVPQQREFWADFQSGAFPVPEGAEMAEHALGPWSCSTSRGGGEQRGQRPGRERHPAAAVERRAGAALSGDLGLRGGELKRIEEGRRLTGTPQTTAGTPITATTALMRFYAGPERADGHLQ